eukprot:gene11824-5155_t
MRKFVSSQLKKNLRFFTDQYNAELLQLSQQGIGLAPNFLKRYDQQLTEASFEYKKKFTLPKDKRGEFHKIQEGGETIFEYQKFDKEFSFFYFQEEKHFPEFTKGLLPLLKKEIERYQNDKLKLDKWKLMMNFYECENLTDNEESPLADFYRHENDFGVFLFTLNFGSSKILQTIKDNQMSEDKRKGNEILMLKGSLVKQLANGRWDYMTRIKPTKKVLL